MKTTIKAEGGVAVVQPLPICGEVMLTMTDKAGKTVALEMTPDQLGALIFGIEAAMVVLDARRERMAA